MHQNTKPFACIACASDSLPKPLDSDLQDEHSLLAGPEQLDRLGAGFRPGRVATDLRVLGEDHGAECERDRERGRVAGDAGFVSRRICQGFGCNSDSSRRQLLDAGRTSRSVTGGARGD